MHDTTSKDMLTDLGRRLVNGSLTDAALQEATGQTPNFAILPWVNVVKIGGQSIMDRGRVAVRPVVDEIVANLKRHKMILGTGAGTRARHSGARRQRSGRNDAGRSDFSGNSSAWSQHNQEVATMMASPSVVRLTLSPHARASRPAYSLARSLPVMTRHSEQRRLMYCHISSVNSGCARCSS